ncbi:hypothetical protein IX307_002959 [Bacteroides pyogenes]|nr:hypothetical protein [Bacteroides pyogenes]MBR8788599.1 hypothetical protein [Bacteroides pyogenes]MBR8794083.1 hypothetical protein [Bacteroides pyogenes]
MHAAVASMYELCHIFQHIVERFDNASFTQHEFVIKWYESLFHV